MVKKATKQERNFQVRAPPERTREISASRPRPCWKMIWVLLEIIFWRVGFRETYSRVSRDQVTSAHLLEELQENAEREAVEELIFAHGEDIAKFSGAAARLFESKFDGRSCRCL
jgi:hypothetical protein